MELPDQGEIFGAADEQFDSGEIGGFQGEGGGAVRNGSQATSPALWQRFKDRITQDIGMVAMTSEVAGLFPYFKIGRAVRFRKSELDPALERMRMG